MNAVTKSYPFLLSLLVLPFFVFGQQVNYSITSDSFAPLAGNSSSASYAQFSAIEPIGGTAAKDSPDFKNFIGFIGQLPAIPPLDQDNDGISDKEEIALGTDINNSDSDGDGLTDGEEITLGTNPLLADSDSDGYPDLEEINQKTDPLSPVSTPVVVVNITTNKPMISNGFTTISATILTDSSDKISETGFVITSSITFEEKNDNQIISTIMENKNFSTKISNLSANKTHYARSFAKMGEDTIWGNIVRIRIEETYEIPFNASAVESGWFSTDWFGSFKSGNNNWIYHTELSWLYIASSSPEGSWIWEENLGWGWTRKDLWPYIWTSSPQGWVYFFGKQKGMLTFWDYTNSEYLKF